MATHIGNNPEPSGKQQSGKQQSSNRGGSGGFGPVGGRPIPAGSQRPSSVAKMLALREERSQRVGLLLQAKGETAECIGIRPLHEHHRGQRTEYSSPWPVNRLDFD